MSVARVVVVGHEARVYAPFECKDLIKSFPGREWDPDLRCWVLARWQADAVANALRAAGCTVYVTKQDGSAWNSGAQDHGHRSTPSLNWAQQLLAAVGKERADAACKAMSRVLHPDVGGSHELMQQLNAARDELMSRGPR